MKPTEITQEQFEELGRNDKLLQWLLFSIISKETIAYFHMGRDAQLYVEYIKSSPENTQAFMELVETQPKFLGEKGMACLKKGLGIKVEE